MFENYYPIVEGAVEILIAIVIIATILQRGKNPYLSFLAVVFILTGVFNFFPIISDEVNIVFGENITELFGNLINVIMFYGMAGYITFQLALLRGRKISKSSLIISFSAASVLTVMHLLCLKIFNLGSQAFLNNLSEGALFVFYVFSLIMMSGLLGWLIIRLKSNKPGVLNYTTTLSIGIALMISSLIILKTIDRVSLPPLTGGLTVVSYALAFAGFITQISLVIQPGMVYDYETLEPIPLAVVRVESKTGDKIFDTCVTNQNGRYTLLLNPGEYRLSVVVHGYRFPTDKNIGYKGEPIKVTRPKLLGLDIALDRMAG